MYTIYINTCLYDKNDRKIRFTLTEGRNRQIRRMAEALGLHVVTLHRTSFSGITLKGLSVGNWMELTPQEMTIVQTAVESVKVNTKTPEGGIVSVEEDYD